MTSHYRNLLFTDPVKAVQDRRGSRRAYAQDEREGDSGADRLTGAEASFIAMRDSLYMATVSEGGWPYIQHRGGPRGFVKVLSPNLLAFADYRGNRQYISVGNLEASDKAAFFFMDYVNRTRLKLLGRVREATAEEISRLAEILAEPGYKATVERVLLVDVEAFDWNCPQHITPRFTLEEIEPSIAAMRKRIAELEAQVAARAL